MKASVKRLLYSASCCIPHGYLGTFLTFPLLAPFYHIVSDEKVPHVDKLYSYRNVPQFEDDLEFLLKRYSPLSLAELFAYLKDEQPLPKKSLFLSFDDGLSENYDIIAPILKQKGVPATFFLNSATLDNADMLYRHKASLLINHLGGLKHQAAILKAKALLATHAVSTADLASGFLSIPYGKKHLLDELATSCDLDLRAYLAQRQPYLTTPEVKSLISEGFSIGAHSVDHPPYPEVTIEEQLRQTRESLNALLDAFALECKAFAFPFGDNGVSKRFFSMVRAENLVDVLFGSSAFLIDEHYPLAIQRLGMENLPHSAEDILRMAELKFMLRLLGGRAATRRVE